MIFLAVLKQNILNYCTRIKKKFVDYDSIRVYCCEKSQGVLFRFWLYHIMTFVINMIVMVRNKIDINATMLEVSNNGGKIILDKSLFNVDVIRFSDVDKYLNSGEFEGVLWNRVLISFILITNEETTCLKNYVMPYCGKHANTLQNILTINGIKHNKFSVIKIKYLRDGHFETQKFLLKDVYSRYIDYFLEESPTKSE